MFSSSCVKVQSLVLLILVILNGRCSSIFNTFHDSYELKYSTFNERTRQLLKHDARRMFEFAYDNYMRYAFPYDELDPIHCTGRGPDRDHPENININDALGDYSLGLVDSLTTLVVLGNRSEFVNAVRNVIEYVSFDKDSTVQVFEATIRVIGALLSSHLIITDADKVLGDFTVEDYDGQLLTLAHDLANRLLPAFQNTQTGIPFPRVNLRRGVLPETVNETCTAGAGSLLLEFGVLSKLLNDPVYENLARRTNKVIWSLRDKETGLLGNVVNVQTGEWVGVLSGLGAGIDSFFEYLLKTYILFGSADDYAMFQELYSKIKSYLRRGRDRCTAGHGLHPMYVNVHMKDGSTANTWIDALQASFAAVQILNGDVEEAVCHHALYYGIWKKYGMLPERYNWKLNAPDVSFYPLRPEFAESTYLLYMATKNPFYLHVGQEILLSLDTITKVPCGYATVHDVNDRTLEDRMESFFLSETCKYLFLLFDENNPVNVNYARLLFTTEGHIFPVSKMFRNKSVGLFEKPDYSSNARRTKMWLRPPSRQEEEDAARTGNAWADEDGGETEHFTTHVASENATLQHGQRGVSSEIGCQSSAFLNRFSLPLSSTYLRQLYAHIGLSEY